MGSSTTTYRNLSEEDLMRLYQDLAMKGGFSLDPAAVTDELTDEDIAKYRRQ